MDNTTLYPPVVLVGGDGAGKRTVADALTRMAQYRQIAPDDAIEQEVVWQHVVATTNNAAKVQALRERGFLVGYVFAPPSMRHQRLMSACRIQPDAEVQVDDTPPFDYDVVFCNYGSIGDLDYEIAEFLGRKAV